MQLFNYLEIASRLGDAKAVEELLSLGADPNSFGAKIDIRWSEYATWPVISIAARHGSTDVVKLLIKNGANVNTATLDGRALSPLMIAVENYQTDIVKVLLSAGANPNFADTDLMTPLHVAARQYHGEIVTSLIEAGANIKAKTKSGITPYTYASANDNFGPMWEIGKRRGCSKSPNAVLNDIVTRLANGRRWSDIQKITDPPPEMIAKLLILSNGEIAKYIK